MKRKSFVVLCSLTGCLGLTALSSSARLAADPTPPPALSQLDDGGKRLAADDLLGAIRSLRAALRADPGNAESAHLLTVAYLHAGQFAQAVAVAQAETDKSTLKPEERARAALLLGTASYSLLMENIKAVNGERDSFAAMKQMLQQMAPRTRQLPSGNTVIEPGDDGLQSAALDFNNAIKARIDTLQKTLAQSEGAFRLALSINPRLPGAHDGLGLVRAAQGYIGEARTEFHAEIAANGANGRVSLHLAEVDLLEHQDEEAAANLRLAAALCPDLETPYHDLALLYERRKDDDCLQWAKGMSALKRGDLHGAGSAFARPSHKTTDLLCAQAQLALQQKRSEDARGLLAQARTLDAHNAEVATRLGDVEASLGHSQEAIASYRQALGLDASSSAAWYGIGRTYDALQDRESAVADYREALRISPNDPDIRLHLANDEAELGEGENSASDFSDYLRRFPTASNSYLVLTALSQNQAH